MERLTRSPRNDWRYVSPNTSWNLTRVGNKIHNRQHKPEIQFTTEIDNMEKRMILMSLLTLITILTTGCSSNNPKITIVTKNYPLDTVRIVWMIENEFKEEKIPLINGKGETEISIPEYTLISVINDDPEKQIAYGNGFIPSAPINFFAETGKDIRVQFNNEKWPTAKISGGKVNTDYMLLWSKTGPLKHEERELLRKLYASEDENKEQLNRELSVNRKTCQQIEGEFIQSHPDSYISLHLLQAFRSAMPFDEYEQLFLRLGEKVRNTALGQKTSEQIATTKKSLPGQPAPEFSKKDKDGNTIRLSDLRGQHVLIDFWGTWCIPCRKSHPHLVELHGKYAPRGVYFINIAQENGPKFRTNWLKAIEEDKLTWTQILNDEGQEVCDVVSLYSITAFPTKILIDPEGKIVGRYQGDSKELDEKLKEIFKK